LLLFRCFLLFFHNLLLLLLCFLLLFHGFSSTTQTRQKNAPIFPSDETTRHLHIGRLFVSSVPSWGFSEVFQCFLMLVNAFQCLSVFFQCFFNAFQCFSMLVNAFQCFFNAFQCFFNAFRRFLLFVLSFSNGFGFVCMIYLDFLRFFGKVVKNTKNEFLGAGCPAGWSGQTPPTPPPPPPT